MLKFDKFNESVLYNHIIFPCIDELATTDEFLKKNADFIKEEFIRTKGAYLSWLVKSIADPTYNADEKESLLNLIEKVYQIYDASYQKIDIHYKTSFIDDGSDKDRAYKWNAHKELSNLLDSYYRASYLETSIQAGQAKLLNTLLMNKVARKKYLEHMRFGKGLIKYYYPAIEKDNQEIFNVLLNRKIPYELEKSGLIRNKNQVSLQQYLIDCKALNCLSLFIAQSPTEINALIEGNNLLLYAIDTHQIEAAKIIIQDSDIDLNFVNHEHKNALHLAVERAQVELVAMLLEAGVSPYVRDQSKQSPLSIAHNLAQNQNGEDKEKYQQIIKLFQQKNKKYPDFISQFNIQQYGTSFLTAILNQATQAHVIPDVSLFSHINTGYKMKDTKLEGNQFRHTANYLIDILKRNQDQFKIMSSEREKILNILEDIKETDETILQQSNKEAIPEIVGKWIDRLKSEGTLAIGGGYQSALSGGHAMPYLFELKDGKVQFKIYQTGDGLQYHKKSLNGKKHQCFKVFEFDFDEIGVKELFEKILYHRITAYLENKEISSANVYFDITGLENWEIHELPENEKFDNKLTPKTMMGNAVVFYNQKVSYSGHEYNVKRYALISNGTCLRENCEPDLIGSKKKSRFELLDVDERDGDTLYKRYTKSNASKAELIEGLKITHPHLLGKLGAKELHEQYKDKTFIMGQISGNCSYKSLQSGLLKDLLTNEAYQHTKLIIQLQSLLDFTLERQSIGDITSPEIKREIEDAIEKIAKLIHDKKAVLQLSSEASMDILRFLETIQYHIQKVEPQPRQRTKVIERITPVSIKHKRSQYGSAKGRPSIWSFDSGTVLNVQPIDINAHPPLQNIRDLIKLAEKLSDPKESAQLRSEMGNSGHALKQKISSIIEEVPLESSLFDSIDENKFYSIEGKEILALCQALQKYIEIYCLEIRQNFIPVDTVILKKMFLLLEWANQRAEVFYNLKPYSSLTKQIFDKLHALESLDLYVASSSNPMMDQFFKQLLMDRDIVHRAEPVEILKKFFDDNVLKVEDYIERALELAIKSSMANLPSEYLGKINIVNIPKETQERLVANYIALQLSNPESIIAKKISSILPQDVIQQCQYEQIYHNALQSLFQGIFMQDRVNSNISFSRFELGARILANEDNQIVFELLDIPLYVSIDEYKKALESLYYDENARELFRQGKDFFSQLQFGPKTYTPNDIQVYTTPDKTHLKNNPYRAILHTRTDTKTQFVKTLDYLVNHSEKLIDPHFQRLMWVNLFNKEAILFAKENQPEAFFAFINLLNNSIKKHIDGEYIDKAILNLFDLFAFMQQHLIEIENPELQQQQIMLEKFIHDLIKEHSPEKKEFAGLLFKKNAYLCQSRLFRTSILMLMHKEKLNLDDIERYLQAKAFLGLHPCLNDLPMLKRLQEAIAFKVVQQLHDIPQSALDAMINKIFSEYPQGHWHIDGTSLVNEGAHVNFNLLTGNRTMQNAEVRCIPEKVLADPHFSRLFPTLDFATHIHYFDDGDKHYNDYFNFEWQGDEVRYHIFREAIQHEFILKNNPDSAWWQLLASTYSGERDKEGFTEALPRILRDKSCDVWANYSVPGKFLITKENGMQPQYIYHKREVRLIQKGAITDYKLLALDNPDYLLSRLADFEDREYILAWHSATLSPRFLIEMPRYNLSFTGEKIEGDLILKSDLYPGYKVDLMSVDDINESFSNYIKLLPIEKNSGLEEIILIPNQQFILKTKEDAKDLKRIKYNALALDIDNSFQDVYENKLRHAGKAESDYIPFKHDPRQYDYANTQGFTEYTLHDGTLVAKNQGELLQAIYIYLGSNDYDKAYAALNTYINQEGGFLGSAKEIQMLNCLLNDIPRNIFHYKDPRHDKTDKIKFNHPVLIAIKLKLAIQMAKYINSQGKIHLSKEEQESLRIKDWEMNDIHGVEEDKRKHQKASPSLLTADEMKKMINYWLQQYDRQFNNIPIEMRLTVLDKAVLKNLIMPDLLRNELENRDPVLSSALETLDIQSEKNKPQSILEICKKLNIDFKLDEINSTKSTVLVSEHDVLFTPKDVSSQFYLNAAERANEDYRYAVAERKKSESCHENIIKELLKTQQNENKTNIALLVEEIKNKNDGLKNGLDLLSKEILDLANAKLTGSEYKTELIAKRKKKLTMADLNRLFVQNNIDDYEKETLLTKTEIQALRSYHFDYLQQKLQSALYVNFLKLTDGNIDSEEKLNKIVPDIYKWSLQERAYEVVDHPEFLLFEAEEGILISKKQYQILHDLLSINDLGQFKSQVMQLIMGGGKSKVLLPLLALCKAKGNNLSMIVVPDALLNTNFSDLARVTKRLFNQDIYHFYFSRNDGYSEKSLITKVNQLKQIIANKSFVVMGKTALEDLELKLLELEKLNRDVDKASIILIKEILFLVRTRGDVLIDEIHAVHDIRIERNFSLTGCSEKLNPRYVDINIQFSDFLQSIPYKNSNLLSYIAEPDSSFTSEELGNVITQCIDELVNPNNQYSPIYDLLRHYPDISAAEWLSFFQAKSEPMHFATMSDAQKEAAYIVKEQLTNLLPLNLAKDPLEHYGPTKRTDELNTIQGALSKPYSCADTPSENSRFSSPFETLNYTLFYNLKYGINIFVLKTFIEAFQKQARDERELSLNTKKIAETKVAVRFAEISGLNPEVLQRDLTESALNDLYQRCFKEKRLIKYCLQHIILPEIDVDTLLLRHNSINHASQFNTVQGFSGTILSPHIFDPRMDDFNYSLAKGTDGETIHHIVRKDTPVLKLNKTLAKDLLKELFQAMQDKTSALIDVGGTLKGISNKMVAQNIAQYLNEGASSGLQKNMEYVLFFNDNDQLCGFPISEADKEFPKTILIGSTDPELIRKKLNIDTHDKYFVYYDQSHTLGVDVKQGIDAHALVTCGHTTLLSKLLQGVMRMRSFAMNQSITLVIDHQVQSDLEHKKYINFRDILNYVFENQLNKIANDNVMATRYMLANVIRNHLIKKLLNTDDHYYFKLFEDILFDKQVMNACQLFSALKKKGSSEEDFKNYRDMLLDTFYTKAKELYASEELDMVREEMMQEMDLIIQRQLNACPHEIETVSQCNYDTETVTEKDVNKEKDMDKDLDTNIEMEMQMSIEEGAFKASTEISWRETREAMRDNFMHNPELITVNQGDISFDLFHKLADYVPKENLLSGESLFSSQIYLSVNQRLSDHNENELFHPLKKPVECILWTQYEDLNSKKMNLRATLITSTEYGFLMENPDMLPKNSWVESQLATPIMGIKPQPLEPLSVKQSYSDISAQIAYYNCDLKTLLHNKSNHTWILEGNFEEKMQFLKMHILPFHPQARQEYWPLFESYFTKKYDRKLSKAIPSDAAKLESTKKQLVSFDASKHQSKKLPIRKSGGLLEKTGVKVSERPKRRN